jgi:hypothetical protein
LKLERWKIDVAGNGLDGWMFGLIVRVWEDSLGDFDRCFVERNMEPPRPRNLRDARQWGIDGDSVLLPREARTCLSIRVVVLVVHYGGKVVEDDNVEEKDMGEEKKKKKKKKKKN